MFLTLTAWKPESPTKSADSKPPPPASANAATKAATTKQAATKPTASAAKPASGAAAGAAAASRLSWPPQLMAAPIDPSVPDVSDWSTAQVTAYFGRHGFSQHAPSFEHHVSNRGGGGEILQVTGAPVS